jgi:hypothetical protein
MPTYFPRHTVAWKLEEPPAFRKLTLSLPEMAIIAGVVLRLLRTLALTHGPTGSWLYFGGMYTVGLVFLFAMLTAHLGNYTIRHWAWRAPVFALVESAAEMLTSLLLIAVGREPYGTSRAEFGDWPAMATHTLLRSIIAVSLFTFVLAGVVQLVRWTLLKREHREHTAEAIHEEIEREREMRA